MDAAWLVWLERTAVATAMRESTWLYPVAEIVHIVGFVILVGAAAMFDLRLLGLSRSLSVTLMARHLLPWARVGLLLALPPGLLMFASDATLTARNPAFLLKLSLIAVALLNVAVFHTRIFKSVGAWDRDAPTPPSAKLAAIVSLTTWAAVIAAGRLIAYV
jgi:hypothetical protein